MNSIRRGTFLKFLRESTGYHTGESFFTAGTFEPAQVFRVTCNLFIYIRLLTAASNTSLVDDELTTFANFITSRTSVLASG